MSDLHIKRSRVFMRLSAFAALIFLTNVLLGKGALLFGWKFPFLLDGTPEFVLLLVTVLLFVIGALMLEQVPNNKKTTKIIT